MRSYLCVCRLCRDEVALRVIAEHGQKVRAKQRIGQVFYQNNEHFAARLILIRRGEILLSPVVNIAKAFETESVLGELLFNRLEMNVVFFRVAAESISLPADKYRRDGNNHPDNNLEVA